MSRQGAALAYAGLIARRTPGAQPARPLVPWVAAATGWNPWRLRPAAPDDEPAIRALVRAERMNPTGLTHPTFLVACIGPQIVGAAQIRRHRDGVRELGSLVVAPAHRGRGIGTSLIRTLLAHEHGRLHVICGRDWIAAYERFGFRLISGRDAPAAVQRNLRIGQLVGLLFRLRGRTPLGLCVLGRPPIGKSAP